MTGRGCVGLTVFVAIAFAAFLGSSYFWFGYFVRGRSVPAPDLLGKSLGEARALLSDSGLFLDEGDGSRNRHADKIPVGSIAWQNRGPGTLVKRGSPIYVGKSLGPLILSVPDLTGEPPRTALLRLSQQNLRLGSVAWLALPGKPGIVGEDPPIGTVVPGQASVSFLVAQTPPPVRYVMPDLIDRRFDEVRSTLDTRGLNVTSIRHEPYPGLEDGTVIRQFPLPGSPVSGRDLITVVVSGQRFD